MTPKSFSANMDVLKVMSNDWYDVETNEVSPQTKIGEITNRLIDAGRLIDDSEKAWVGAIRSKGGDKGAATRAAQDMIPGGKTQLFNTLSQNKCLVNVRSVGPPLILADSVGPPIILADMDEKTKAAEYKKHDMAMLQALVRLAGPLWLDLAKLIHGSGEWYGWASKAEVTLSTHPWLREYDDGAESYLQLPPSKRRRTKEVEKMFQVTRLMNGKEKLKRELRIELQLYKKETMGLMNISQEGFAVVAAEGKKLYAWMAELLKTDPDCLEEVQAIQCDLDFMTDMVDKAMHGIKRWWV